MIRTIACWIVSVVLGFAIGGYFYNACARIFFPTNPIDMSSFDRLIVKAQDTTVPKAEREKQAEELRRLTAELTRINAVEFKIASRFQVLVTFVQFFLIGTMLILMTGRAWRLSALLTFLIVSSVGTYALLSVARARHTSILASFSILDLWYLASQLAGLIGILLGARLGGALRARLKTLPVGNILS